MRVQIIILSLMLSFTGVTAQKKALTEKDFASWKRIENRQISADGKYVMYELNPLKGDGKLIIHNTTNQKIDTIFRGCEARFVPDAEAVAFKIKAPEDSLRKHKLAKTKKENMPKDSIGVLQLTTGRKVVFTGLKSFAVADEIGNKVVALLDKKKEAVVKNDSSQKPKPTKKPKVIASEKDRELFDLSIIDPIDFTNTKFNKVESYAIAKKGNRVVAYSKLNDSTRINLLISINTQTLKADTLLNDSVVVKKITLDEKGEQLAFLQSSDTAKIKNYSLYYSILPTAKPKIIADSLSFQVKPLWTPSEYGDIYFSNDGKKLFFGMAPKLQPEKTDKILDEEKPKLDVWSYTDTEIQPKQLKNAEKEKKKSYLTVYRTDTKKLIQLADSLVSDIRLLNRNNSETALGINHKPYQRTEVWLNDVAADYYLIDLKTGAKNKILTEKNDVWISPSGNFTLYYEKENIFILNNKTRKITNLTENIKVSFVDELNDIPAPANLYGIAGWTEKEGEVLIYDRYDIWKFDVNAKNEAVNMTNGRNSKARYRYLRTDNEEVFIPTNKPVLLSFVNEISNKEGFCELVLKTKTAARNLYEGDFMLANLTKAKDASSYIWSSQTTRNYPEVQFTDSKFATQTTLSQANAQQADYNWLTVEKIKWLSFAGDSLNGLLYKPENFDPNRRYPMLVYFYERNSENIHRHSIPQPSRSTINIPYYCSNEYIVFVPDITYKTGYPGQSAYDAIVSGVYHLLETKKYINEKKNGIAGAKLGRLSNSVSCNPNRPFCSSYGRSTCK